MAARALYTTTEPHPGYSATNHPGWSREAFLGWTAGFFDGEGYVGIAKVNGTSHRSHQLRLSVSQVDPRPLELLRRVFGGNIRAIKPTPRRRRAYDWRLNGHAAADFLRLIEPYLVVKAEAARIGIVFASTIRDRHDGRRPRLTTAETLEREALRDRLLAMNYRGPR